MHPAMPGSAGFVQQPSDRASEGLNAENNQRLSQLVAPRLQTDFD